MAVLRYYYLIPNNLTTEINHILKKCVGNEAYNVYRFMKFENADDRKKLDPVIAAFEKYCVVAVNVAYERYVFNRHLQECGERFEAFLGKIHD